MLSVCERGWKWWVGSAEDDDVRVEGEESRMRGVLKLPSIVVTIIAEYITHNQLVTSSIAPSSHLHYTNPKLSQGRLTKTSSKPTIPEFHQAG